MPRSASASALSSMSSVHELADRTHVLVRPIQRSDRNELAIGYEHLSLEARRRRFFAAPSRLSEADLDYLTNLDYRDHFAWAAFAIDEPHQPGIGVARYVRDAGHPDQAEVAVTVLDAYQHRGLGTLLLQMLAEQADRNGITTFVSHILWENNEVIEMLVAAGASVEPEEPGVARVALRIPTPDNPTLADLLRTALRAFAHAAAGPRAGTQTSVAEDAGSRSRSRQGRVRRPRSPLRDD